MARLIPILVVFTPVAFVISDGLKQSNPSLSNYFLIAGLASTAAMTALTSKRVREGLGRARARVKKGRHEQRQ